MLSWAIYNNKTNEYSEAENKVLYATFFLVIFMEVVVIGKCI